MHNGTKISAPEPVNHISVRSGLFRDRTPSVLQDLATHRSYGVLFEAYKSARHPLRARFFKKVARGSSEACWLWAAAKSPASYGKFNVGGKTWQAHRVAYVLARGPFDYSLTLDHLCRNPSCVNPSHLEPVTIETNLKRGGNAIKTHCKRGHPLSGDNLPKWKNIKPNKRCCLTCHKVKNREAAQRRWQRVLAARAKPGSTNEALL